MENYEYQKMYDLEDSHWWFVTKRTLAMVFLNQIKKKFSRILDVGCGTGRNLLMLQQFGQVFGVDINPLALKFCLEREQTQVKRSGAETLPFKDNYFDLVTIFDVLYHQGIKSDIKALAQAFRVIKPGGYLLVNDCAHQWLYGPHDRAMQARQRYSRKELVEKITTAGFRVKRASYTYLLTFPLFLTNRLLKKFFFSGSGSDVNELPPWLNRLLIFINQFESRLLHQIDLPIGSSIMVLAQKPQL
jgi:ubiquinone/menaquinone biosynthesis C-methylase UbiE